VDASYLAFARIFAQEIVQLAPKACARAVCSNESIAAKTVHRV
jgi:hypothetical protein